MSESMMNKSFMTKQPPNILILHTDQQRYDSLGCMGNSYARTPNLDRLAAGGTLFTRHISSNTLCMPSRAGLMTGLYPPGHNVWTNGVPLNRREYAVANPEHVGDEVRPEPPTMADIFGMAGYDTVAFGKLHLTPNLAPTLYGYPETWSHWDDGDLDNWHGPYYGFRYVEMTQGHGEQPCHRGHYAAWLRREHPEALRMLEEAQPERPIPALNDLYASPLPADLHNTTWLANRFCDYVHTCGTDQPWFAFVGFPDPHHPFTPSYDVMCDFEDCDVQDPIDPTGETVQGAPLANAGTNVSGLTSEERRIIRRYTAAMIYQIDRAVGHIVEGLKAAGQWENTVIVFTSDHGDFLGDHGRLRKGYTPSDTLLHIPFILRAPGVDFPTCVDTPMSNVDVLPTLAALAGIAPPDWCHGIDMGRVMRSKTRHFALAFCANGDPEMINYTFYDDAYRFTIYPHTDYVELFDHRTDPGECRNLAQHHDHQLRVAALTSAMQARLMQYHNPILARVSAW